MFATGAARIHRWRQGETAMSSSRYLTRAAALTALILASASPARADDTVKIGLITPLTGPLASNGRQIAAGAQLYMRQNGTAVAGKRIELIVRDDGGVPDASVRLAQELIVRERVDLIGAATTTAGVLGMARLVTEAKKPAVVMLAGTTSLLEKSPYLVRTSFTLAQSSATIADWATKNNIKKVVTMVSDFAPGHEAEAVFQQRFAAGGGQVVATLRFPVQSIDFVPYLQRARDASPEAVFVFVPSGQGDSFAKQFAEVGLDRAGIKLIGTGDVADDDLLPKMSDAMLGAVTAHYYSAAHPSPTNRAFVEEFRRQYGYRPNFMAVSGYDGMQLIYQALRRTGGAADGDALLAAMKGLSWESPRGPISIDPDTRDVVHDIYLRKVERVDGELYSVEFAKSAAVKNPTLSAR
jgi:branched-chain amino acid transport system substrate-binding protein